MDNGEQLFNETNVNTTSNLPLIHRSSFHYLH